MNHQLELHIAVAVDAGAVLRTVVDCLADLVEAGSIAAAAGRTVAAHTVEVADHSLEEVSPGYEEVIEVFATRH
jgi:hypothetical protein